jgi:hypothetical protein
MKKGYGIADQPVPPNDSNYIRANRGAARPTLRLEKPGSVAQLQKPLLCEGGVGEW